MSYFKLNRINNPYQPDKSKFNIYPNENLKNNYQLLIDIDSFFEFQNLQSLREFCNVNPRNFVEILTRYFYV